MNDKGRQQEKSKDKLTHRPDQTDTEQERLTQVIEVIDSLP